MSSTKPAERRVERHSVADKAHKACMTCRRQKMKCVPGTGESCRRCERAEIPCVFIRRANMLSPYLDEVTIVCGRAAVNGIPLTICDKAATDLQVIERLDRIESFLGLRDEPISSSPATFGALDDEPEDASWTPLWAALNILRASSKLRFEADAWKQSNVKRLWQSFHETMPGLHFMPEKQIFTSPIPLLLAAMLYCSSSRGSVDVAIHAPVYHLSLCAEIAALVVPQIETSRGEEEAFQIILGIVLAALLSEATYEVTGLWITIAYRIFLEHCPPVASQASQRWQKLLSGLQILDLEHCSLRLNRPSIPLETSLGPIRPSLDELNGLSRMMHVGLCHFSGRGLPTIWSYFSTSGPSSPPEKIFFSGVDAAVIRDWARQLDAWLAHFSTGPFESAMERRSVYRQYVMHRLCVLSIYLPSRHYDLFAQDATPDERHELLESARSTIMLHSEDSQIWANWDLVMITWAACIVLQAIKEGYGQPSDLRAIRHHLHLLRQTHEPTPNLRHKLADRLERSMEDVSEAMVHTAIRSSEPVTDEIGYHWALFEQSSLQNVDQWLPP